jgi:hypothetical protein
MKMFSLSLLVLSLVIVLLFSDRITAQPSSPCTPPCLSPSSSVPFHFWLTTRLTSPSQIYGLSNHSLVVDTNGRPHLLYGQESLFYTWHDATTWHQEYLDTPRLLDPGPYYQTSALALDSANIPHLVYINENSALLYANRRAGYWRYFPLAQTADSSLPAIAMGHSGFPHIVYAADPDEQGQLHYLYQTEQGWFNHYFFPTIDSIDVLSLALDQANHPHIAYATSDYLHYATWDGSQWQLETVQPLGSSYAVSIALDSQDRPAIAYQDGDGIRYTTRTDQGWNLEIFNNDAFAIWLSLALDHQDIPHLAYYDTSQDRQMYATRPAATWLITVVDDDTDTGHFTDIALDQQGQPHLTYAYYPFFGTGDEYLPAYTVRYAHLTGSQWLTETASFGSYHRFPSIAIASDDSLHVVYKAYSSWRYAHETASGWLTETITMPPVHPAAKVSFVLDAADNPHLAYFDSKMALYYAYRSNNTWVSQLVTTSLGVPFETLIVSLALDNSQNPHLAYFHRFNDEVHYAYRSGDEWVIETVAANPRVTGGSLSLALDSLNRPHLAYEDDENNQLMYARRVAGQWLIEALEGSGTTIFLALDSQDHPHIAHIGNDELTYTYWSGKAWLNQVVDQPYIGYTGSVASLVLDQSDHPYIAYTEYRDSLKLAHFDGKSWLIHRVDAGLYTGNYPSLALNSQGIPFILHQDRLNGHLKLSRPAAAVTYAPLIFKP